jgi:hypothetical protein
VSLNTVYLIVAAPYILGALAIVMVLVSSGAVLVAGFLAHKTGEVIDRAIDGAVSRNQRY